MSQGNHSVQLFDSVEIRAKRIAAYVREGLESGGNVLVVASPANWQLVSALLEFDGIAVNDAQTSGRLTVLDAARTLAQFMNAGMPDRDKLEAVVGTLVSRLAEQPGRLHIYGEMVDVLAESGNFRGAHRLEELWNGLASRVPFDLFCGYTAGHFGDEKSAAALKAICDAHTSVHSHEHDLLAPFLIERSKTA